MTIQMCIRLCRQQGKPFALLRAGNSCRCQGGQFERNSNNKVGDSECNIPCAGDPYDICGGPGISDGSIPDKISVYDGKQW